MQGIREADWKRFRQVSTHALERFCERVLTEASRIAGGNGEDGTSNHDRYLKLYKLIQSRDEDLAHTFNDARRSVALIQLANRRRQRLVTEEEFSDFTPETQERVRRLLGEISG